MKTQDRLHTYRPGYYGKKRLRAAQWAEMAVHNWNKEQKARSSETGKTKIFPSICFSRQIGVGALEIADSLAEKISYRVADREILEHMAKDARIAEHVVARYDERYQGSMEDILPMFLDKKSFKISDFAKQLLKTVVMLAETEPTIFVGRGCHLLLPRELVLAVRMIGSEEFRANRISDIMDARIPDAKSHVRFMDREQAQFFKAVYGNRCDSPEAFDLTICRDYIPTTSAAVAIVNRAFEQKFGK